MDAGERQALIAFYKAAGGDSWRRKKRWCSNAPLGEWHGVVTNDQGSVVKLMLVKNNLVGTIPPEIGQLRNLQHLDLHLNNLSGTIPSEIGQLKNLQHLDLGQNTLGGIICAEIGELKNLQTFKLYINKLSGTIPAEMGKLANLRQLLLGVNKLHGFIPKELGLLINLERFDLSSNNLTGSIPKELGLLIKLEILFLSFNNLTGTIPKELGFLIKLKQLLLYNNKLTGAIPEGLSELKHLTHLYLFNNQLNGAIPKEFGELKDLQRLYLSNNQISGAIPKELGQLKDLQHLTLSNNQLSAIGGVEEAQWLLSKFEGRQYGLRFDLRGNSWIMPPEAVVENGLSSIKTYYTDVQRAIKAGAKVTSRRLLKVVLVGSSSVGKTSLMESIISRRANRTEGTLEEASTEGIDVRPHQLQNTSIEFYDCAGQVDYGGMHQVFLTRRALFLLVWDITRCFGRSDSDLDEEIRDMVMRWLYTLHLRAPGTTVILVGNKCDKAIDDVKEIVRRVEKRVHHMLKNWKDRRGQNHRKGVNLFGGSFPVSCDNYAGISALINRINQHSSTKIDVPPAWDLALHVIDALRRKRSPMNAAREYLDLPVIATTTGAKQSGSFIPRDKLSELWGKIVREVKNDVHGTKNEVAVNNWDSALEGALWISEFAGQVLLVDDGNGIFLDVVWLSHLLTPILSHKLRGKLFPTTAMCALRDDLVDGKILRWEFARYLWKKVLDHSALQSNENVGHALYRVLIKLGVALPLGQNEYETASLAAQSNNQPVNQPPDMLVIMRLRETCGAAQQTLLERRTAEALTGVSDVTLKWIFDTAGCPYGLMERLIASCHLIGVVEQLLCWRYGALFRSHEITRRFGRNVRLYTIVIRYDKTHDTLGTNMAHVLTVRMMGPLESPKVWTALRFVASAVVTLAKEWPGVIVKGSPACPRHPMASTAVYLTIPEEARIGGRLISRAARGARSTGCDCHAESTEVVGLIVNKLGDVVDTKKDPFQGIPDSEIPQPDSALFLPEDGPHLMESETLLRHNLCEMYRFLRPYAWQTAAGLWGLALVLFGGVTAGVVEEKSTFWHVCLAMMIISLVGAAIASVISYQDRHRREIDAVLGSVGLSTQIEGDVEIPLMTTPS